MTVRTLFGSFAGNGKPTHTNGLSCHRQNRGVYTIKWLSESFLSRPTVVVTPICPDIPGGGHGDPRLTAVVAAVTNTEADLVLGAPSDNFPQDMAFNVIVVGS